MKKLSLALALVVMAMFGAGCSSDPAPEEQAPVEQVEQTTEEAIDVAEAEAQAQAQALEDAIFTLTENTVYFDFNKYDISEDFYPMLQAKADVLRAFPNLRVRIEGNCDTRGTQEYNLALGERRARAAYEYLVLLGVNPDQLSIVSYGKERPVALGNTEEDHAMNRRDNFTIIAQ